MIIVDILSVAIVLGEGYQSGSFGEIGLALLTHYNI